VVAAGVPDSYLALSITEPAKRRGCCCLCIQVLLLLPLLPPCLDAGTDMPVGVLLLLLLLVVVGPPSCWALHTSCLLMGSMLQ
jgi:hypothetical protein